jgi:hypothetical protein
MLYRLLADGTLALHLAFVAFVVLGGLLVLRRPALAWLHVPAVVWGVWVELAGWTCPLTPLENWLRMKGGVPAYPTSFIGHYLVPVLYPAGLTRTAQLFLAAGVLAINAAVYARLLKLSPRRWLPTLLAWLATTAVLAPVCFFGVFFLAGPHGGALPDALAPAVLLLGWAVLIGVPILVARRVWRRGRS